MDHIRQALSQEQERLFGPHKIAQQRRQYQAKVGERLEHLREQDKIVRARAEAEMAWEDNDNNGASPAVQAQNRERQKSWGWPGLGTFPEAPKDPAKTRRMSVSPERAAELEHKVEEATYEAIDSAAESEAYGWPGVGEFPVLKKR